jgi:hypothetical protein
VSKLRIYCGHGPERDAQGRFLQGNRWQARVVHQPCLVVVQGKDGRNHTTCAYRRVLVNEETGFFAPIKGRKGLVILD